MDNAADNRAFGMMLAGLWEAKGKEPMSPAAVAIWKEAMRPYSLAQAQAALSAHVQDPDRGSFLPMPADIIRQIKGAHGPDGYPDPEEAWSLVPRSEEDSAVWCDEIAAAWYAVSHLMPDEVAARMAFKSAYGRELAAARAADRRPKWHPTLGHDKAGHDAVLTRAVAAGRLSHDAATKLLPPPAWHPSDLLQITDESAEVELTTEQRRAKVAELRALLGTQERRTRDIEPTANQRAIIDRRNAARGGR